MVSGIVCIARARKDAKALSHALKCDVISLGGVRKIEDVDISKIPQNRILFFFCGRDDIKIANELREEFSKKTITKLVYLNKKAVRNARIEEIKRKFELAKAELRLFFEWDKNKEVFKFSEKNKLGIEVDPDYDAYFVCSDSFAENMNKIFKINIKKGNLIIRKKYNEEWIYSPKLKAIVSKRTGEKLKTIKHYECEAKEVSMSKMTKINEFWIKMFEEVSLSFLRDFKNFTAEKIDVPFSGGKDSLVSLILSCKAFSPEKVRAIYIKTKYELPKTEDYVRDVCEKLNVELLEANVNFSAMETDERQCTKIKLEKIREVSGSLLVVGDRDAESRVRRLREEVREIKLKCGEKKLEINPIKYWSGCLVQLYAIKSGFKLHPLYYSGFYRIGCSICPFMGNWEKILLSQSCY